MSDSIIGSLLDFDAMPSTWQLPTVGDVFQVVGGGTPSTKNPAYWGGDVPWITSADIHAIRDVRPRKRVTREGIEHSATNLVPEGTVIVVTRVGLGKLAVTPEPLCFSQDSQALLSRSNDVHTPFQLHYLSWAVHSFKYRNRGTTISGVTTRQLKSLPFPLPPLNEQRRIVAKIEALFSELDAGVAALERSRALLARYRQSLLKAAFSGDLTADWRAAHQGPIEPAETLLARIRAERAQQDASAPTKRRRRRKPLPPLDTSALPELPEGWCWARLGELGEMGTGATPKRGRSDYYENGMIPWVTSGVLWQGTVTSTDERITDLALAETNCRVYPIGTLLVAMYGEGRTRGTVAELGIEAATNQACAAVRVHRQCPSLRPFLRRYLQKNYGDMRTMASGGVQPNLNLGLLAALPVALAPAAEQVEIVKRLGALESNVAPLYQTVDDALARASRLRQAILKRAFEGRLVPQDPTDEPAAALLARIQNQR